MKKLIITTIFLLSISNAFTQESEKNSASFNLGEGISFSFNEGKYELDTANSSELNLKFIR